MPFRKKFLDGIRNGSVTLAFRRWKRPTVQDGGTLLTPVGELAIESGKQVTLNSITPLINPFGGIQIQVLRLSLSQQFMI
jgi:hypothetical protein